MNPSNTVPLESRLPLRLTSEITATRYSCPLRSWKCRLVQTSPKSCCRGRKAVLRKTRGAPCSSHRTSPSRTGFLCRWGNSLMSKLIRITTIAEAVTTNSRLQRGLLCFSCRNTYGASRILGRLLELHLEALRRSRWNGSNLGSNNSTFHGRNSCSIHAVATEVHTR